MKLNSCQICGAGILPAWRTCNDCSKPVGDRRMPPRQPETADPKQYTPKPKPRKVQPKLQLPDSYKSGEWWVEQNKGVLISDLQKDHPAQGKK